MPSQMPQSSIVRLTVHHKGKAAQQVGTYLVTIGQGLCDEPGHAMIADQKKAPWKRASAELLATK